MQEIQVDFEGRNPIDSDFHGIRQLLAQLFQKATINLSELSDLIIGQNYVGSVVTQCMDADDMDDDDDEDEDMSDTNMVFGITTAINISNKTDIACIKQIRTYILEKATENATDETANIFRGVLGNTSKSLGFLLNERFVNIPPQISLPMLESLVKEVRRANQKKMNYNFAHYVMFIKFYRTAAKKNRPAEDVYTNAEEESMCKAAAASFEYSVEHEESDSSLIPFRKIILFESEKLPDFINTIKELLEQ